ncbi:MAG: carbohydrate porin, partial [Planctomycetota bacterium]
MLRESRNNGTGRFCIVILFLMLLCPFGAAFAEDKTPVAGAIKDSNDISSPPKDSNSISKTDKDNKDVSELLEESKRALLRQRFEDEVILKIMNPYLVAKKYLHDEHNLDTAMEHILVYQRATGGRRPREQSVYNFTFFGHWDLFQSNKKEYGIVGFSFEERDNVTDNGVSDFSSAVGTLYKTNDFKSEERSRTALRQLWWRKKYDDDRVTLTIGKLHHPSYYNRNTYAGSARTHFLSQPFARNPNRLIPHDGLGFNVTVKADDDYYISAGIGDAKANTTTSGF